MIVVMVRIPVGSEEEGERIAERFRNRAGLVDSQPGFLGFELLKGDGEYISATRWATREDLNRWMGSQANVQAHAAVPSASTQRGHPESGAGGQHNTSPLGTQAQGGPAPSSVMVYEVVIPGEGQAQ